MAVVSVGSGELDKKIHGGRPKVVDGSGCGLVAGLCRAYVDYLGVVERLGCSEKLVTIDGFSQVFSRVGGHVTLDVNGHFVGLGVRSSSVGDEAEVGGESEGMSDCIVNRLVEDAGDTFGGGDTIESKNVVLSDEKVTSGSMVEGTGVSSLKKKKMGKNQKDRAKARLAMSVGGDDWRKPVVEKAEKVDVVTPVVVVKSVGVKDVRSEARASLEEKWVVENQVSIAKAKLAKAKAEKDLEFQRARDVDAEVRKSRARIMRETESSKVATEKAFASLKASGNVPGFCATVVSDGPGLTDGSSPECTISPDSSASMHEFRATQKQLLDAQKEIKDLTRQLRLGKLMLGEEVTFTAKSDGDASEELTKALDELENERFYVDRSEDPACFGVNKTIYAKRMYIDTHSYDGDY